MERVVGGQGTNVIFLSVPISGLVDIPGRQPWFPEEVCMQVTNWLGRLFILPILKGNTKPHKCSCNYF